MLKVGTVCTGIGSPEQAIKELNIPHEIVFGCEIDKYAKQTYMANFHPKQMLNDMTTEDWSNPELYTDLFIGGIPCQAFSLAGKRMGELDPRGLLFYNFYDYVKKQQPKYFIIENVKGLLSDAGGKTFQTWLYLMGQSVNTHYNMFNHEDSLLYNLHWTVLNSKDFGVPQNRERVFIVGIRNDLPNNFRFPLGFPLTKRLKDILEPVVDEKYYLSEKMLAGLFKHNETHKERGNGFNFKPKSENDIGSCVTARVFKMGVDDNYIEEPQMLGSSDGLCKTIRTGGKGSLTQKHSWDVVVVPEATQQNQLVVEPICVRMQGRDPNNPSNRDTKGIKTEQVIEPNSQGITNTITSVQKDNLIMEPKIIGYTRDEKGKVVKRHSQDNANTLHSSSGSGGNTDQFVSEPVMDHTIIEHRGHKNKEAKIIETGIVPTLRAESHGHESKIFIKNRIRRLTPLECFRLQGFPDSFIRPCSETQTYKQAGNSITVNVIKAVLKNLLQ